MMPTRMRQRGYSVLLALGLLVSVTLNGLQIRKIRSLQRPLDRCIEFLRRGGSDRARIEMPVAVPIAVRDLTGHLVNLKIPRNGKTTVIYIFSPGCIWCKRNSANMKALMEQAGPKFEFVPVSLVSGSAGVCVGSRAWRSSIC